MTNSNNKDLHNSNHNTHKDISDTANNKHKNTTHDNHDTKKNNGLSDSYSKKSFSSDTDDADRAGNDTNKTLNADSIVKSEDSDAGSVKRSNKGTLDNDELNDTLNDPTVNLEASAAYKSKDHGHDNKKS